ncbi:hypothetical protein RRG08_056262 [Elysia crispata]|uniref:DNA ligase 1-like n=1 Tax=Elysia crispata TaxID=231223 RepID=A0AAE1AWX2_9GAST|nr:hypothetical protein RRG08_056262 [Elysia crispata]
MQKSIMSFFSKVPQNKAQEIKTPTKEAKKEVKSEPQKKEGKERTSPKKEAPEIKKKSSPAEIKKNSSPLKPKNGSPPKCEEDSPIKNRKRAKKFVIESDEEEDSPSIAEEVRNEGNNAGSFEETQEKNDAEKKMTPKKESQNKDSQDEMKPLSTPSPSNRDNETSTPEKTPGGFYSRRTARKSILGQSGNKRKTSDSPEVSSVSKKLKEDILEDKKESNCSEKDAEKQKGDDWIEEMDVEETAASVKSKNSSCSKVTKEEKKNTKKKSSPMCKRNLVKDAKSPKQAEESDKEKQAEEEEKSKEIIKEDGKNKAKGTVHSFFAPKSPKTAKEEKVPEPVSSDKSKQTSSTQESKRSPFYGEFEFDQPGSIKLPWETRSESELTQEAIETTRQ